MEHLPCDPEQKGTDECVVFRRTGTCFEDVDHLYWPASDYKTRQEKKFRSLDENKRLICRALHQAANMVGDPSLVPDKPAKDDMQRAIERDYAIKRLGKSGITNNGR